ncbi:MAG: transglutaminase-like domain-containing protein [Gammaproteobacteria bacterium]
MQRIARYALCLIFLGAHGCATVPEPTAAPAVESEEFVRAAAAKEAFAALAVTDDWYGIYFQDQKSGYLTRQRTARDGHFEIVSTTVSRTESMGTVTESSSTVREHFSATAPYDALLLERLIGDQETGSLWRIRSTPQGYVGEHREAGRLRTVPLFDFQYRLADAMAIPIWLRAGAQTGQCLSYPDYDLENFQRQFRTECIASVRDHVVDGAPVEAATTGVEGAMTLVRDRQTGRDLSLNLVAQRVELRLEPRSIASDLSASFDFFLDNIIQIDRPLGEPERINRLTLDFEGLSGYGPGPAPGQWTKTGNNAIRVVVDRTVSHESLPAPRALAQGLALSDAQRANLDALDLLVREAGAQTGTQVDRVTRLVNFVYRYIEPDFSSEPLSLAKLLATRRGDCTEYSQLLDALLKAARVPSREVTGLVYMGDEYQHFAHHAWNEVYINGAWLPVDASWNEVPVNATHIRYPLSEQASMATVMAMRGVRIKVVNVGYSED